MIKFLSLALLLLPTLLSAQGYTIRKNTGILPKGHPLYTESYTVTPDLRTQFMLYSARNAQRRAARYPAPSTTAPAPTPRRTYTPSYRAPARTSAPAVTQYPTPRWMLSHAVFGNPAAPGYFGVYYSLAHCQTAKERLLLHSSFKYDTFTCMYR